MVQNHFCAKLHEHGYHRPAKFTHLPKQQGSSQPSSTVQRTMGSLREHIQGLCKRLPTRAQILLCVWVFGIAIRINFIASHAKVFRVEETGGSCDELRGEVDCGG